MKAPRYLATWRVGVHLVEVYEVEGLKDDRGPLDGEFDGEVYPHVIRVSAAVVGARRWAVIFHELTHLAAYVSGLRLSDEREEVLARAVEQVFTAAVAGSLTGGELGRDLLELPFFLSGRPALESCRCERPVRQHRLTDGAWRCGRCTLPLSAEEVNHAG